MSKTVTTPNYPIVVGDVLTAGQDSFKIKRAGTEAFVEDVRTNKIYILPLSIVQAIGTVDPKTGTPRV